MNTALSSLQPPEFLQLLANNLRWRLLTALARSDLRGQELVQHLGQPQNLVSYHLKQLRDHGLVSEHRSAADGRDIYYSLTLERVQQLYLASGEALHPALSCAGPATSTNFVPQSPLRVLFLCTHNSARSQMAEGLLKHLGGERFEVFSAGNQPAEVHPDAVRAMAEAGIDISGQRSKSMAEFLGQRFDYVITVCDRVREVCPVFPDEPECIHWSFPDPAAVEGPDPVRYRAFQETARQLATRIGYLLATIEHQHRKAVKQEGE
jgi:protein-tyrosine-phosphatase